MKLYFNFFSQNIGDANIILVIEQVALVDVLWSLHIKPDGIVGHSVGELGCAYADGCLTADETVLAAYWRGQMCHGRTLTSRTHGCRWFVFENAIFAFAFFEFTIF